MRHISFPHPFFFMATVSVKKNILVLRVGEEQGKAAVLLNVLGHYFDLIKIRLFTSIRKNNWITKKKKWMTIFFFDAGVPMSSDIYLFCNFARINFLFFLIVKDDVECKTIKNKKVPPSNIEFIFQKLSCTSGSPR